MNGVERSLYLIDQVAKRYGIEIPNVEVCEEIDNALTPLLAALETKLQIRSMAELSTLLAKVCTWHIDVNDHRTGYATPTHYFAERRERYGEDEDVTPELIAACEVSGEVWRLQVYSSTPVGFVVFWAASLQSLVEQVRAAGNIGERNRELFP